MDKNLLLILTRNPELGKCKTRLAKKVGDGAALDIYKFLLDHTVSFTKDLNVEKWVYYSEEIWENDIWDQNNYQKKLQVGAHLGERMLNAFQEGFNAGFEKIVIIGSDMYHLSQADMEEAFLRLNEHDYVVGPAEDGGYYLLGMKSLNKEVFHNKSWGTDAVLSDTLKDLESGSIFMLPVKNDVDYYEDIKNIEAFQPFLKHIKNDSSTT
ncbi:TIGR04282 family arsenosugar biosynthesis glycosyltransferase [Muricauda sp. CAU 1633]|uniref:TIGR04282 family arsenosugar biosynthesis glycosyltransferase n=1 Tax=Allomuricauda sp. CAU 1633 TaxID=2816036 RepID=UPI001A8C3885|nr:TIGR04282 family arsenosugar biosynthesis glycosyltransferase [Muricauda sp. CAU 1633]MBO0321416.1 TIGR04282 family arsenosugar biosynthesis glycosyltransferase [Muricauda sp. CAU 1633]